MTMLREDQRRTVLSALSYRLTKFPREQLLAKLKAMDKAYHLTKERAEDGPAAGTNQEDSYSRYQELDDALVREVVESYFSYLTNAFLGTSQIFKMTSTTQGKETANKFNVILADEQRRGMWEAAMSGWLLDTSKYNLGALVCDWDMKVSYNVGLRADTSGEVDRTSSTWQGNVLHKPDMYNVFFDTSVNPNELAEKGEYAGYVDEITQTALNGLIEKLKIDKSRTVYDTAPAGQSDWSVYNLSGTSSQLGFEYHTNKLEPLGAKGTNMNGQGIDHPSGNSGGWAGFFGLKDTPTPNQNYQVMRAFVRLVPSAYRFPAAANTGTGQEIWEFYILDGIHVLATKRLENAHGMLPFVLAQTDADSLKYNSAGPGQIAIPYQKTCKQLMDRILAGADRAIRDRAIVDEKYISLDAVNSSVPDSKIRTKANLPNGKRLQDVYYSIPYNFDSTGLGNEVSRVKDAGQRAAGINNSQAGQFTKGNRTLEEYQDVQANAANKQYLRALLLEATAIQYLKRMIKLNILQFQESSTVFDPETEEDVDISRADLFKSDTEFAVADALKPTEHMVNQQTAQQFFALLQADVTGQLQQQYNVPDMIVHIAEQSMGLELNQYKRQAQDPAGGQPPNPTRVPPAQQ